MLAPRMLLFRLIRDEIVSKELISWVDKFSRRDCLVSSRPDPDFSKKHHSCVVDAARGKLMWRRIVSRRCWLLFRLGNCLQSGKLLRALTWHLKVVPPFKSCETPLDGPMSRANPSMKIYELRRQQTLNWMSLFANVAVIQTRFSRKTFKHEQRGSATTDGFHDGHFPCRPTLSPSFVRGC